MKKYLIAALVLALTVLGAYYLVYYQGIFLPVQQQMTQTAVPYRTQGRDYQRLTAEGQYETLTFRGVDLYASRPGDAHTQYAPDEADYLRWFDAIADMGANLLRVNGIMDDDFYNALYAYNTAHAQPLYLLQGMSVSDRANAGPEDAYSEEFFGALVEEGRALVDVIHGRKNITLEKGKGSGSYRCDVSPWVIGWLVGSDWDSGTIAYTDHRTIRTPGYSGAYVQTTADASLFETMLAQVMDGIAVYENSKYSVQRPMAFVATPACDFLEYDENYADQLKKFAYLDAEHVMPTQENAAGVFAAYRLYEFCDDYTLCLSEKQRQESAAALAAITPGELYGGYLRLLSDHHTVPMLIAGYNFSTARTPIRKDREPVTEREQGEAIVRVYLEAMELGFSGVSINSWQDRWELNAWNTVYGTVPQRNYLWHDLQNDSQNYGILAFEPGDAPVCLVDGDPSEWTQKDRVLSRPFADLYVRYDVQGLYLMIKGEGVSPETPLYLPIDTTQKTGSAVCDGLPLRFSRPADFLLCLDGVDNTRLLVQDRYDGMRQNFGLETTLRDPFINYPDADSANFGSIRVATENAFLLTEQQRLELSAREQRELRLLGTWDAGKLVHGNADPASESYHSLADFCFGEGCVEILIPWGLVNVGDPSDRQIHDDYYEYYGVKMRRSSGIYLGLMQAEESEPAEMARFRWKDWEDVKYRERLKDSYQVIAQCWR